MAQLIVRGLHLRAYGLSLRAQLRARIQGFALPLQVVNAGVDLLEFVQCREIVGQDVLLILTAR